MRSDAYPMARKSAKMIAMAVRSPYNGKEFVTNEETLLKAVILIPALNPMTVWQRWWTAFFSLG